MSSLMVAKEIHQSETVILRKIRVAGTWEGTQELCTFHSTFYVKLLKKLYTVWCQLYILLEKANYRNIETVSNCQGFWIYNRRASHRWSIGFVLLRIVKLLNVILKWWIDEIIYYLLKCIYGTLQAFSY